MIRSEMKQRGSEGNAGGELDRRVALARLVGALLLPAALTESAWGASGVQKLFATPTDLPPLSYLEAGQNRGMFFELLLEMAEELKLDVKVELQPISRAHRPNQRPQLRVVYPLVRTPEREDRYLWVGPVFPRRVLLVRLARRTELIFEGLDGLKDAKVGVNRNTATQKMLESVGLQEGAQLQVAINYPSALSMLLAERTDYLAMNELALVWNLRQLALPADTLTTVAVLDSERSYWYGFSRESVVIATAMQAAFERLRAERRADRLRVKYGL